MLQNLPPFSLPQLGQNHLAGAGAGAGLPHSEQNLPLLTAPQEQTQPSAGLEAPHSIQNLPVFTAPQEHFQVFAPAAGAAGAAGAEAAGCC